MEIKKIVSNIIFVLFLIPNSIFIILFAIKMTRDGLSLIEAEDFIEENRKAFNIVAIGFYIVLAVLFIKPIISY